MTDRTLGQQQNVLNVTSEIVKDLTPDALVEISKGVYGSDFSKILEIIQTEADAVLNNPKTKLDTSSFGYMDKFTESMEETLRCRSLNYFISSVLPNFTLGWHNLEWSNLIQINRLLCILASRDSGKSYHFDFAYPLWQMYRFRSRDPFGRHAPKELQMARDGMLITNEIGLAINFMDMIKTEIKDNPILAKRLLPDSTSTGWGKEEIRPRNRSILRVKSAGSKIRGHHPTWINLDDFPNESSLYSQDARDKLWNIFSAVIFPALSPGGSLNVVGTPFIADLDVYGKIKAINKKDIEEMKATGVRKETWKIFEYPAIFPDGRLLFPQRHDYKSVMQKRDLLGSIIFSREILVRPISDGSTVFPMATLKRATRRSGKINLLNNIKFSKQKFVKVAIGCDFAMSAGIASDYSCFTVLGMDEYQNLHLLNSWIKKGADYKTQLGVLKKMNADFRPDIIVMETNNIGQIMYDMAKAEGLPAMPSVTGIEKKSLRKGIPALAVLFERNKFVFPYGDKNAQAVTDRYFSELSSMTFIQDKAKFESVGAHDDTCVSLYESVKGLYWAGDSFNFSFIGGD